MTRGRPAYLQRLYELQLGESLALSPPANTDLDLFEDRVRQVSFLYLKEGKAYRLERRSNDILATRVKVGSHTKLGYLADLKIGERHFVALSLEWKEKKALLASLERVNAVGSRGRFVAEVDEGGIFVRCYTEAGGKRYWNNDREYPEPVPLTLRRG